MWHVDGVRDADAVVPSFAIVGAGGIGRYIVRQFLAEKVAGTVNEVVVLTRPGSNTTVEGDAKVVPVDYSNHDSIKNALNSIDVVISAIGTARPGLQPSIAAAAQEAGVKLFVPSEFGGVTEGATEGLFVTKANIQSQLKEIGIPYTLFYTGPFADFVFNKYLKLDLPSGKVELGGDGSSLLSFAARADVARYLPYALTRLPAEKLQNRASASQGRQRQTFNAVFKQYEEKTGTKLDVAYVPLSELEKRLAANSQDIVAFLHKVWATYGPFGNPDNDLYPGWNPSSVIESLTG
ncbi:NAD-P-binding protein [Gloeopeniophorella convolvens]|nr:NAD-P-binding protein [Gloeopeniophorella convolvens]